ncbi:MAG: DUF47 family protein [Christensenella sp.]|nr:DUF47 family protein [Christensenella sp.]
MARKQAYNYFNAFVQMTEYSCKAASILDKTLRDFDPDAVVEHMRMIHEIEHEADQAKHEMMKVLIREFLPPIEREDVAALAQTIDDVTDAVEDVIIKIYTFNIRSIRPEALEFMDLVTACCSAMKSAMQEFHNFKKSSRLMDCIIEINRLEGDGDELYTRAMRNLHVECDNPIEILNWSRTYSYFEKCCDTCEDVADIMESIIMKNT